MNFALSWKTLRETLGSLKFSPNPVDFCVLLPVLEGTMSVQAVFFDLDDTLIVDEAVSRETFQEIAEGFAATEKDVEAPALQQAAMVHAEEFHEKGPAYPYCQEIGISAFECLWGTFIGDDPRLGELHQWVPSFRRNTWMHALNDNGVVSEHRALELADQWAQARAKNLRDMPGAKPLLRQLATNHRLGLLTNGSPSLQRDKIALAQLGDFFDAIAISGEVRIGKPRPGIFEWLCRELEIAPEQAVMVGNSLGRDILGAQNAGIRQVWIHVPGAEGGDPKEIQPDATIQHLEELPQVLEAWA